MQSTTIATPLTFEHQLIIPPSPSLLLALDIASYLTLAASTLSYALLLWLVTHRSPKAMGNYCWYLIFNLTASYMNSVVVLAVIHPRYYLPYPLACYNSPLGNHFRLPQTLISIVQCLNALCLIATLFSQMSLFLYRYSQLAGNRWVRVLKTGVRGAFFKSRVFKICKDFL